MTEILTLSYNNLNLHINMLGFPGKLSGKETSNARDLRDVGSILGQEDPLEEGMATHSSIFAWRIPWKEEPGGLWPIGLQRVGHN